MLISAPKDMLEEVADDDVAAVSEGDYTMARSQKGSTLVESASAFTILVPLIVLMGLVVIQSTVAYVIHASLTQAALEAAHDLGSVWVSQNQPNQALTSAQQQYVYNGITIPNVIPSNTSGGNNPNFSNATFDFTSSPQTVTVTAMFIPGYGMYSFPWKALNAAFANFIAPTNLVIRSSCTYPLPSRISTGG